VLVGAAGLGVAVTSAAAQVMLTRSGPIPKDAIGQPDTLSALRSVSLLMVEPPKPRVYAIHDKVTIIISETSSQTSKQTLDTKKDVTVKGGVNRFPNIGDLLQGQFTDATGSPIVGVDVSSNNKFKGEGTYDRSDRFSDRVTATVIDVKPNGVLVLEAKRTIKKDDEEQTLVLSGECRREDVTQNNTVLSNELAELTLVSKNSGRVKESATKGWIPRVLEAIFNF
jgi:flagellar L-ring protein precursor FlgH